jgi:alpha-tubulin suppressor-like RCC1 family protein
MQRRTVTGVRTIVGLVAILLVAALPAAGAGAGGSVLAWGCASSVDLGQCAVPTAAGSGVTALSAGPWHSLALKEQGRVLAWGCGLGSFDAGQCSVPAAATSGVTAIAAGTYHNLALKQDGSVITWGCGGAAFADDGQCTVPVAASSGVTAVAAADFHSLALKQDGSVLAWGCRTQNYGQCSVPADASSGITAIAAGTNHSIALKQDGSVVAWGCGRGINWGNCTVPAAAASGVTAIAAGPLHDLALKQDGSVIAWGCGVITIGTLVLSGDFGQCTVPAAAASGVTAIAAGYFHSLALKQDGSVLAWGCDGSDNGQCTVPAEASTGVTAIAAGAFQSLALVPAADPAALLAQLAVDVAGIGPGSSLSAKVEAAQSAQARGALTTACHLMDAFVQEVRAGSGETIDALLAGKLAADATNIESALGC